MPRKKASVPIGNPSAGGLPLSKFHCPACKSEISADGGALHTRSEFLEDLIERDGDVEKLEKLVESLEGKLAATEKKLETKAVAVQTKPEGEKSVEQKEQPKRGSWW
jgi:hypothetical protein